MHEALGCVTCAQACGECFGTRELVGPHGLGIPFGTVAIVDRDEGGLTALGEAYIEARQIIVDCAAQSMDGRPLRLGIRAGDARRLGNAGDLHGVRELDLAHFDGAADRGRRGGFGRARKGHMPFACEQARGGVKADPAGTRQVDLGPGMQIGEVAGRSRGTIQ